MFERKYWPFLIALENEAIKVQVSFLNKATQEGHRAYVEDETGVLGAVAADGRQGEIVPRSGRDREMRRYWEVVFGQGQREGSDSFFVDGFENAAEAVLCWLRGEQTSEVKSCVGEHIVRKP